jgi:hypothetical protein
MVMCICERVKSTGFGVGHLGVAVIKGTFGSLVVVGSMINFVDTIRAIFEGRKMTFIDYHVRQSSLDGIAVTIGFDLIASAGKAMQKSRDHFQEAFSPTPPSYRRWVWSHLQRHY